MIETDAWMALKSRMDQWTECAIMYPNVVFTPASNLPFMIVQDVALSADTQSVGYGCGEEYRGIFNVSVMAPVSTWNYTQHKALASRVAAHFIQGSKLTYGSTTVKLTQRARILGNVRLDSTHNRLEVQIPWLAWG